MNNNEKQPTKVSVPAKPFIFRIRGGHLIGVSRRGVTPCANCFSLYLNARNVFHEPTTLRDLTMRRELITECTDGVCYEINEDGAATRMECRIDPHPDCGCKASPIESSNKAKLNYVFTAIQELVCSRYSLPQGNLWLARATRDNGNTTYAVAPEREAARNAAAYPDKAANTFDTLANNIVARYREANKSPLLIVGVNTWARENVPFFLLQQYDVHFMFYPNALSVWIVGMVGISRQGDRDQIFVHASGVNPVETLKKVIGKFTIASKPWDREDGLVTPKRPSPSVQQDRWLSRWVMNCSKISLRDVINLVPYSPQGDFEAMVRDTTPKVTMPTYAGPIRLVVGGGEKTEGRAALTLIKG